MDTILQARVSAHEAITDLQRRMTAIRFYGPGIRATEIRRHIDNLGQVIAPQDRVQLLALCQLAEQDIQEFSEGLQQAVRAIATTFEATLDGGERETGPAVSTPSASAGPAGGSPGERADRSPP